MYIPFYLREEYREYMQICQEEGITPNSFRDWFDVYYHYEMEDNK